MKKRYPLFAFLIMAISLNAQKIAPPVKQWHKALGGSNVDKAYTIIRTFDHGYLVVGESFSNDGNVTGHHGTTDSSDAWIVKLDTSGNIQWQQSYGGTRNDRIKDVIQAGNGDFICVGTSESNNGDVSGSHDVDNNGVFNGNSELWVLRITRTGSIVWSKLFGGTGADAGQVIRKASDGGGYVIGGNSDSNDFDVSGNHGYMDIWLLKINESGALQWQKTYGSDENQYASDLIVTSAGDYIISGYNKYSPASVCSVRYSEFAGLQIKVTNTGALIRNGVGQMSCYIPGDSRYTVNLLEMPSGDLFTIGVIKSAAVNNYSSWVLKRLSAIDNSEKASEVPNGNIGGYSFYALGPHQSMLLPDSNTAISCLSNTITGYKGYLTLISTNNLGNNSPNRFKYSQAYGGSSTSNVDIFSGIDVIDQQQYIAAGYSNSTNGDVSGNHGNYDYWVVKFSALDTIKGKAFIDKNANGVKDAVEPYAANFYVESKKNGLAMGSTTDKNGFFINKVDTGTYTTTLKLAKPYYTVTPVSKQSVFTVLNKKDSFDFAMVPLPGFNDLEINIQPLDNLRPGGTARYRVNYFNPGTESILNSQVQFIKPQNMRNISAVPAAAVVNGDTLRWNTGALAPLDSGFIIVTLQAQPLPQVDLGERLVFYAQVSPLNGDARPADNRDTLWQVARGSFDPNDKTENFGGVIYSNQSGGEQTFEYSIRFQNTGTDTAFGVTILDTLSNKFDPSTLQMLATSHRYTFTLKDNKYCSWKFDDIKLVDSVTNEPLSHGYISYRIRPSVPIPTGDSVMNRASIYFDYNPGVKTNNQVTLVKLVNPAPPTPVISGLQSSYCNTATMQKPKINNLPPSGSGNTATVKLDSNSLSIAADSTFSFDPSALSTGTHRLLVVFANSAGSDSLVYDIVITAAITPDVNLSANTTSITDLTTPVHITASNAAGGGNTPLYTFASDRSFTNITQAESNNNVYTVNSNNLPMGDNWVYVRMKTSVTCYTSLTVTDSIKLNKLLVPERPTITGLASSYCGGDGVQKIKIINLPPDNYLATATAKLDAATALTVGTDSTISLQPTTIAAGNHTIVVAFTNASGSNSTMLNFSITRAANPDVNLSANSTTVLNNTDPIVITATNAADGGASPKYTFAKDKAIANILQAESSSNTISIQPNTLTVGANWVYVKMKTSDTCFTAQYAIDSIKIERSTVTGLTDVDFPNHLINIYPNPFAGMVTISGLNTGKTYTISISNAAGQKLYSQQVANSHTAVINKSGLQSGKYWLSIYDYKKHKMIGTVSLIKD